jgi:hypothetical protein
MVRRCRILRLWRRVSGGWLSRSPHGVAGSPLGLPASLRLLFLLMLVFLLLLVMGVGLRGMMRW